MFKNLKLGSKLILIVGSLIVCSVAISGVIFYYNIAKNTLTERTVAQLESIIVLKENQLNFFAERSTEDIKGLADEKSLVNNFKKLQKAYVSQEADGMVYSENIKQLFKERLAHKESFIEFFALDLNGKILTSTNETRVGKIRSNEIYFLHGIRGSYYQNFYYDKDLHQPAITVSAPIKNDEGKTIGVLAGRINIEKISDIITERSGLGETGETYLVNKFNLLVSKSRFIKGIEFEKVIHTEGVKNCLKGTFDTYNNDYRNIPVIGLHKWLAEKEVCLLAKIDQDEVFELAKESRNILFLISLGIILLSIISGTLLSRRITNPLEHLTATARTIADGDLTKRVEVISKDEIGQLATAFNEMATKLKASYTGLEKKIKERTLQIEHEKSKLETTLESIGDGAFVVDKKGIITFFNKIAEELSGFSAKEALGKPYKDIIEIVREKDRTENYTFIETALQKGKIARITNHSLMITKDGRTIAVADSASPIKKPNGEIIGCIVVFRNVTREREIDKIKTEFISLASHQLRTPLTSIRWFTEMLLSTDVGKINKQQREFLESSYQSTIRMNDLVNALLNISRIESARLAVTPEPTDPVLLSKEILNNLKPLAAEKKHQITFTKPKGLPLVKTDPKLLKEILSNLLSNSIKYTPEKGKINLTISVKGPNVLFQVKDNGLGIPKVQQNRVFNKFFRGENIVKIDTKGTGLGLYIVKKLVETLQGKVWFESEENKGTTFYFTIPRAGIKKQKGEKTLA